MASKKQQALYKAEYRKARRNLLQNVRRLEKRGYDVSAINIPSIPEGNIKKSHIKELNKLNNARYDLATKQELVSKRLPSGEKVEVLETVSGKRGRFYERKRAGAKAGAELKRTRKLTPSAREDYKFLKKMQKKPDSFGNTYIDPDSFLDEYEARTRSGEKYGVSWMLDDEGMDYYYRKDGHTYHGDPSEIGNTPIDYYQDTTPSDSDYEPLRTEPFYDPNSDAVYDPVTDQYYTPSEIDFEKYVYYENQETGEIIERPWGAKPPRTGDTYTRIMPQTENTKAAYEHAMSELDIMANYVGNPKHGKNEKHDAITRYNASSIKDTLERLHEMDPAKVENAIYNSNYEKDYHSVQFMYSGGGYERYLNYFSTILSGLGVDVDPELDEDYDEGNFEN